MATLARTADKRKIAFQSALGGAPAAIEGD